MRRSTTADPYSPFRERAGRVAHGVTNDRRQTWLSPGRVAEPGGTGLGTPSGVHAVLPEKPSRSGGVHTALPQLTVRIGRDDDNDVTVDDLLVSRHHAELHAQSDGRYELADLGSRNGTF